MTTALRPPFVRVRGRSFMALVLVPEPPVAPWLAGLDAQMQRAPEFFAGKPVVADLSAFAADPAQVTALVSEMAARGIRLAGIEGFDAQQAGLDLPPLLAGGRTVMEAMAAIGAPTAVATPPPPPPPEGPTTLMIDTPVRSGQSVVFARGDITVIGSVASGAELVAGGSIHVYGALRGRAVAGVAGLGGARIFCRQLLAELLAIEGLYRTADDIEPNLRGRAAQAWLEGDSMIVAGLD